MDESKRDAIKAVHDESNKEYKEVMEQFKVTLKLSRIGEHFVNFIVQCRKLNAPPATVLQAFREMQKNPKENMPKPPTLIPMLCLVDWIENPTEENFQNLQKSLGVKIDMIVQEEIKERPTEENKKP